jgi:Uma2 family endonuclease
MRETEASTPMTADVLYEIPDDGFRYELVEGFLVSEPLPGTVHGFVSIQLGQLIASHAKAHRLGIAVAGAGFLLARDPDTVRGPDVAFISRERLDPVGFTVRFFPGAPDLAIEVLSPSNRPGEIHGKVADYLAAGARLVWVVDPQRRRVTVYRSLLAPRTLGEEDALDGEDVLPGFSVRAGDLFEPF